ncbi:MAG: hypothetical protein FWH08_03120 [Oscillospiraceae bacterium]|nr:hypothetical protein [Oscillospiraceae bacterium]
MNNSNTKKSDIQSVRFIKDVSIGSINPNALISDETRAAQTKLLNKCLNDYPKGFIIGKDISIGRYMLGEHELTMQKTTYHIGFSRKPVWLVEEEKNARN